MRALHANFSRGGTAHPTRDRAGRSRGTGRLRAADGAASAAPIEASHRTITIAHLANLGLRLGKSSLKWDAATEQSTDAEINAKLTRPMRAPYSI